MFGKKDLDSKKIRTANIGTKGDLVIVRVTARFDKRLGVTRGHFFSS